jgi:hypothetical protein
LNLNEILNRQIGQMTALKPRKVNKKEQETTSLSTINNQLSPIITSSTNTRINLFQKYKQKQNKIIITNNNNIDDLKTYSTPPQSPNLMINEAQEEEKVVEITQITTTAEQDNVARINEDSNNNNNRLIKIKQNNDLLRDKLKSSYQRLRSLQTKYFQTHVAQQLNKILELKEEQQKSSTITTTTTNDSSSSSIDDNSVDLLTSILKSNLTNTENNNNTNVDLAVKSLLDDIQYEILKQAEENNNNTRLDQDDDPIADNENIITTTTTTTTTMNNDYTDISDYDENNVLDSVDLINLKLKNKQITPTTTTTTINNNNKNEEKKLIDSSNLSTTTTTITPTTKLDTDWECVQAKLKYLKMKTKQCNDYTSKLNRLTNYKQQPHSIKSINNKNKTNEQDIEAIAALSSSLQESVAAAIINVNNNNNNADLITEPTASRCIPYEINSHKTKSHSRLFNLNRNDLIRLDEDVIRSLYFTLKYFNNNYFKTVCTCGDLLTTVVNKTNSNNQDYSLSDLLSMKKTCIFCHLLKEYEKNSINAIINNHTNNNSELLLNKQNNNNNNNDDRLADLNIVRTDHSYCKQFNNNNNNNKRTTTTTTTTNNNNIKLSKQVSSEQNDLLERLVNDRLCRIFDENNNNNNIFEKLIINSNDDEQFIDAGLDLSPNDLKNLPDLSYEE